MRELTIVFCLLLSSLFAAANNRNSGSITGRVFDAMTEEPLDYVVVAVGDLSVNTDSLGRFTIANVPVGRHTVKAVCAGYTPTVVDNVMVSSAHSATVSLPMQPSVTSLGEVTVTLSHNRPLNSMAIAGGHLLDMKEANLYAGSLDDPGRLASTAAGIATDVSHNGLSVHGVAPHLMQWRLEGVEIPNPNHYADISTLGGGVLSSLSSFVLDNSDFFAGAFPAQYGNALSGVFDMRMRNGNNQRYQHALQVGVLGIDLASEGPIGPKGQASYIINYRYSATGLLEDLGVMDAGGTFKYQDLNFKVNLPTRRCGDFAVWGTMFIDKFKDEPDDPADWLYTDDGSVSSTDQNMMSFGANHSIRLGQALLKTTVAYIHSQNSALMDMIPWGETVSAPYIDVSKRQNDLVATVSCLASPTNSWTTRTGATYTHKFFDLDMSKAPVFGAPLMRVTDGNGNTSLVTAYTDNVFRLSDNMELGAGINVMWLTLNDKVSVQPRLSAKYMPTTRLTLSAAAGMYSRMENMDVYFTCTPGSSVATANRNLGFTSGVHGMIEAEYRISRNITAKVSPFAQYLYDVPCGIDDSYSILNQTDFYIDRALVNRGKGRVYGADLALERSLANGWYSNLAVSLFNAQYCGGDGVWRNTRFNRNYIVNLLGGKEWSLGRNNILNLNGRVTYQGGEHYSPFDMAATVAHPDNAVQYDQTNAYSLQYKPMVVFSASASLRLNRRHVSHIIAVDALNIGGYNEPYGHAYNQFTHMIDVLRQKTFLPNLYYRLEF